MNIVPKRCISVVISVNTQVVGPSPKKERLRIDGLLRIASFLFIPLATTLHIRTSDFFLSFQRCIPFTIDSYRRMMPFGGLER